MLKKFFIIFLSLLPILIYGQEQDCLAFEGKTVDNDKKRLDTKAELLFFYTNKELQAYLEEKLPLECHAYLTYIEGGYYVLNFIIKIALANAPQTYGTIPARSELMFTFLDGSKISLKNALETRGNFDSKEKIYTYKAEYPIGGSQLKLLKIKELDSVQVTWSKGMEKYEIYDINFFIRHFQCISNYQ